MRSRLINNDRVEQFTRINNGDLIIFRKEIRQVDQHVIVYKFRAMNDVV